MAQAKDGVFTWIHADHLSSATRITDAAGLEIRRLAYAAFGEEAENQGSGDDPKYTYTGKEHDTTGLYYSGARYYDPALCRFPSTRSGQASLRIPCMMPAPRVSTAIPTP